ncbi:zinc finger BED domain-containing protein RICESLEEPER 1 [Artemisia annua]|uniref:Zinc finger BED domain-containing protein RICESLEEPER 1 n=1 Tax=Artemisia annua TaxID=35608 RepID=A0A2U1MWG8_ARTAN|nr:zinc finger BED domain-containing protein RICESLEEPER 1 [Artemisia annua]
MSDPMEEQSTEGGEALGSTNRNLNRGKRKECKERSEIWAHYDKFTDKDGKLRALCKYCKLHHYSGDTSHGTSNLWGHYRKCTHNPNREDDTQTHLELNTSKDVETGEKEDYVYTRDLREGDGEEDEDGKKKGPPGIPESKDWANARLLVVFLKHFYDMTLRVSGTKYITSNSYLECINCLDTVLKRCFLTKDNDLKCMSVEMMKKFDKYWGDTKKFNMLVFIASVFDPRTKFEYLKVNLCSMYGTQEGNDDGNERIYSDQHLKNATSSSHISPNQSSSTSKECSDTTSFGVFEDTIETIRKKNMAEVKRRKAESGVAKETKTELDRYLTEEIEGDSAYFESDNFTVLEMRNMSIESSAGNY